ncbi:Response regulator receiver domain-containing protein [Saccharopolyspora shandongensis]|uniref:Response regulator receiver domain-containing protein n=1 Tax=Saccharopolyspora shandongensis TaxID=418495 RepID=A0A1H3CIY3_9PSEU|nr:response regulator [Saccharopolyspora shandongensis]SDX54111.1 Response regulator receiver domain-containing protein [Saccharopolyspora shandongensis]
MTGDHYVCANILVAEDDRKQAELLRSYLELDGHDVLVAHDGRSTIAHARRQPPDLLLLDVMLPDVDGVEVCRILPSGHDRRGGRSGRADAHRAVH